MLYRTRELRCSRVLSTSLSLSTLITYPNSFLRPYESQSFAANHIVIKYASRIRWKSPSVRDVCERK